MTTTLTRLLRVGAVMAGCVALLFLWGAASGAEEGADPAAVAEPAPSVPDVGPGAGEPEAEPDVAEDESAPPDDESAVPQDDVVAAETETTASSPAEEAAAQEGAVEPGLVPPPEAQSGVESDISETAGVERIPALITAEQQTDEDPAFSASDVGCPECSSRITQTLVGKTWQGDHWDIVIEATLDSNVVCHVLLFQCVVQPEQDPPDMELTGVSCLSDGWVRVIIDVFGFSRDVCAKFNHHTAGQEQKFRFSYTTSQIGGEVSETVKFYRFPEELIFPPRAENTITIDLGVRLLLTKSCPDTVEAGANITCSLGVVYPAEQGGPPVTGLSLVDLAPPEFVGGVLTEDGGVWTCSALGAPTCVTGTANPGDSWTFTFRAVVDTLADGTVENEARLTYNDGGTQSVSVSDDVTIYRRTDTFMTITKASEQTQVNPGGAASFVVTVTNEGPVDATNIVVTDFPPLGLVDTVLAFVSGAGTWQCAGLVCTAATMPVGSATFRLSGTVDPSLADGSVLVNEVDLRWENDVFGPDFTERAGAETTVVAEVIVPPVVQGESAGTEVVAAGLPFTGAGSGAGMSVLAVLVLLLGGSLLGFGRRAQRMFRDGV